MKDILFLFKKPKEFFKKINRDKIHYLPFLIVIILYLISTFITKDLFAEYLKNMIFSAESVEAGDLDYIIKNQTIISFVINPGLPLIAIIVKAYLINGISGFDGYGELKDSIIVVSYSYIFVAVGNLIDSILSVITNTYGFRLTITSLMQLDQTNYFAQILNEITPFIIYYQILVVIGIAIAYEVTYKRASVFVIGTWITWLLLISGIRTISF